MRYGPIAVVFFQTCLGLFAGLLPGTWTARNGAGNPLASLSDGKPQTACSLEVVFEGETPSVTVDLGRPLVIDRVYWCGDANYKGQDVPFPAGRWTGVKTRVAILAGESPDRLKPVAEEYPIALDSLYEPRQKPVVDGLDVEPKPPTVNTEGDFRFPPLSARHIRLEARGLPEGAVWTLGEVEVTGFEVDPEPAKREAVILPAGATTPLWLAARDLSYYLGELLGRPVPVITTNAAADYSGPLFRIADLKSLAGTAEEMAANLKSGKLPSCPVNVEAAGKEIVFKAWPYQNVLVSVWAFLESQGVRWVYPDPHGDIVPSRKQLDLKVLPLRHTPSADRINANFDIQQYCPTMPWDLHKRWVFFPTESYLYFWRNHWLSTPNGFAFGGGEEVPLPKGPKDEGEAAKLVKDEFKEGFAGYPHNNCGISPRALEAHPDWMGLKREGPADLVGKRSPEVTPCYTSEGLTDFLTCKATAWAALYPETPKQINLLPTDAAHDCECDTCLALNQPLVKPDIPYCAFPTYYASDAYYRLVSEVATRCATSAPNASIFALAYANVFAPPRKIARFPGNVVVEVCAYGHMNLPPDSPRNAKMKSYLDEWASKCKRLETYAYVLLNEDAGAWPMPLPLVSATVDWAKLQHKHGALSGSTQGSPEMIRYCPWNFYAYPRVRWDVNTDADALLKEFFNGYFRESGAAMLAYYKAAEDYHIGNNVSLYGGGYTYRLKPGAFPFHVLQEMSRHLKEAEAGAAGWVTKRRVAAMRRGFDWLVKSTGVGAKRLDQPESIPAMGPGRPPLTVAVKDADLVPPDYVRGGEFCLQNGRRIGQLVRFEADGEYIVSFSGAGSTDPRHRKDRAIAAYIDGAFTKEQPIPDAKGEYRFIVKATPGVREVGLQSTRIGEGPFYMSEFTIKPMGD